VDFILVGMVGFLAWHGMILRCCARKDWMHLVPGTRWCGILDKLILSFHMRDYLVC
jgi:hypothetical protein